MDRIFLAENDAYFVLKGVGMTNFWGYLHMTLFKSGIPGELW